jgi:hypothetical protein
MVSIIPVPDPASRVKKFNGIGEDPSGTKSALRM